MRFRLRKHDKVLSFIFVAMLITSFLYWAFEEQFDDQKWRTNPSKRYKMTDDIIDNELLIEKSKDDVITLLGVFYDSIPNGKDNIVYKLGTPPSFFEASAEKTRYYF